MDLLRFVALYGIITIHVSAINWYDLPKSGVEWQFLNFYDSLYRFCLPCFIMISGALLLAPEKPLDVKKLWKKKIPRILFIWIAWSFLYACTDLARYILRGNASDLSAFFSAFIGGHFHLWYLPMLLGLYIILPILKPIAADRKLLKWFLLLSFIVSSLFPSLYVIPALSGLSDLFDRFGVHLPEGYVFYFMLGYYLNTEPIEKRTRRIVEWCGILSLLLIMVGTYLGNRTEPGIGEALYQNLHLFGAISASGAFLFTKERFANKEFPPLIDRFLDKAAEYSLGIYLIHELVSIALPHLGIVPSMGPAALTVPVIATLVYGISFLAVHCLSRISVFRKHLM